VTAGLALGAHFADLAPDLRRDPRMATLRALAGISLMPTGQPTTFEDKLDKLKICASLVESELAANPVCPHCGFRPANEQGELLPAANVLKTLDDELDRLLDGWRQTLLDNLDDPIIQANFELLKAAQRDLIRGFLASKSLPDPVTPEFVAAVQEPATRWCAYIPDGDDRSSPCQMRLANCRQLAFPCCLYPVPGSSSASSTYQRPKRN